MSIFHEIRAIEFDRNTNHQFGVKSAILWGHSKHTNGAFPILYISKPKHISQDDFDYILNKLDIKIKQL